MSLNDNGVVKTARVPVQSAWYSKINWGEGAKVAAMLATLFGVPQDVQTDVLAGIVGFGALYTWITRTWFTRSVTPGGLAS